VEGGAEGEEGLDVREGDVDGDGEGDDWGGKVLAGGLVFWGGGGGAGRAYCRH
jgi:hypothetical protein